MAGIQAINPYAPAELEYEQFVGWETTISDRELAMKTATLRLFNIGAEVESMEVEVEEMEATPQSGLIWDGTDGWNDNATTGLPISAGLAGVLTNYAVLQVEDELVVVKSVDRTANTIEVYQRGYGSTTAAAHDNWVEAFITGYNYVVWVKNIESRVIWEQTFKYFVAKNTVPSVSFTKEDLNIKRKKYWEQGQMTYVNAQLDRMDKDLLITMNKALITHSGQKGTKDKPWMFVGIIEEMLTRGNVVTSFGAITDTEKLNDALTASRNKGWEANVIIVSPANYDAINKLANTETQVNVPDRLQVVLWASVSAISTKVGMLIPVMDLSFPDDKIVICNTADLYWAPLTWFTLPWADREIAQESTRNNQSFTADSITQWVTYYFNTNRNGSIFTGVTQA